MDDKEGVIAPKSRAGIRTVPILAALRPILAQHRLRTGGSGLAFASIHGNPFTSSNVRRRAHKALTDAGIQPIGLHELRHGVVSGLLAAGADVMATSRIAGHSDPAMTLRRYGHAMPGHLDTTRERMDAYLAAGGGVRSAANADA